MGRIKARFWAKTADKMVSRPEIGLHKKCKQMDKKQTALVIQECETGNMGYRTLARKYGTSSSSISRMIRKSKNIQKDPIVHEPEREEDRLPDDVKLLKREIRRLKLKVALQDIIIDISGKELGVDLRKKPGTRQS